MKNIALVMGGYSGEHDISIASGQQVYQSLDKSRYNVYRIVVERAGWYWQCDDGSQRPVDRNDFSVTTADGQHIRFDLAFIIIHGNPGENGVLQGYFDTLGIRYTTCGFYTSALTFQKGYCNPVVASFGIVKIAKSVLLYKSDQQSVISDQQNLASQLDTGHWTLTTNFEFKIQNSKLTYPLFVKPAAGGSSVATTKVKSPDALMPAIQAAFEQDDQVLVEECIKGREFDCGVFRKADGEKLVFPITEIIPKGGHEFFDYEAKYEGFSNEVTPAECDERISKHIQTVSSQLYDLLGCRGIVRFDYIYDTDADELYFLEVNTIPGQSAESIVPKQARAMGISPAELYEMAIEAALES